MLYAIAFVLLLMVGLSVRVYRRRMTRPAPLGYVRLSDRYFQDRTGFRGD